MLQRKGVLYVRVSSSKQEEKGYSLPAQEKFLKRYAEQQQVEVVKIFEVSESASGKQIRKAFTEAINYPTTENIPLIICEKIDRLTRTGKDATVVSDWVLEDANREVHCAKESFVLSHKTRAHENFVWDMKVAMAKFYINNLSEEVKKGQEEKAAQGWLPTKPPLGYKTVGEKGKKIHVIDEDTAPYLRDMFQLYASRLHSIKSLTKYLYQKGLRTRSDRKVPKSRIAQLLGDPFYYGGFRWNDRVREGQHQRLISRQLYDQVQEILHSKTTPKYRKHAFLFKGMGTCGPCAGTATGEIQRGHVYYHCNGYRGCTNRKFIREEVIEAQLLHVFDYLEKGLDPEEVESVKEVLKDNAKEEEQCFATAVNNLDRRFKVIQNRFEPCYVDKLDGKISEVLYQANVKKWSEEQQEIVREKGKIKQNNAYHFELGCSFLDLAVEAKRIYLGLKNDIAAKRELLTLLLSDILLEGPEVKEHLTAPLRRIKDRLIDGSSSGGGSKLFEQTKGPTNTEVSRGFTVPNQSQQLTEQQGGQSHFRTAKNPYSKLRFASSSAKSRTSHGLLDDFRTLDWAGEFGDLELLAQRLQHFVGTQ
jgi:DNA invertase Pin-like site-specific DNA recombinase